MKRSPKRESWLPRRGSSVPGAFWPALFALLLSLMLGASAGASRLTTVQLPAPLAGWPYDFAPTHSGPRTVIIALPATTWAELRSADLPHLRQIIEQGSVGVMPVASASDADRYRTWATLGAGRPAIAGRQLPPARMSPSGAIRMDLRSPQAANGKARTGADLALLGWAFEVEMLSRAVIGDAGDSICPAFLVVGSPLDGNPVLGMSGTHLPRASPAATRAAIRDGLAAFLPKCAAVAIDLTWLSGCQDALGRADAIIGDVMSVVSEYSAQVYVLSPVSPAHSDPDLRTLAPVILLDSRGPETVGLLTGSGTRWPGLITAADIAPTVLDFWGLHEHDGFMTGRSMLVSGDSAPLRRLDRLDSMLTDRYRLRVPMAKLYGVYGLLAALAGVALAVWRRRTRFLGAAALGVAFVPVGLAIAAPIPPGHDALYLGVSFAIAVAFGLLGSASARRGPTFGLALAMLLGAGLIVADVLNSSPLMRFSALEMGIMMGSRFYGIGNEHMGALVGLTTIGLGAMVQVASSRGRLAALIGIFVTLVVGLACWGANWGGSFTAAVGLLALWLLSVPRVKARHVAAALALLAGSVVVPAALDLLNAPPNRSHIGASAAALLSGSTAGLGDTITRKAAIVLKVIRVAPWSGPAALIAAGVFWLQLRRGAPARRALEGQRFLTAGIAAALIAGVVAMLINDSGPAAGMGAILAALGAVVFLASRAPEVVA